MKKRILQKIKNEIQLVLKDYPNMDVNYALKRAKEAYLKTSAKERKDFSILDVVQ